jgi:predicted dehydrogenase
VYSIAIDVGQYLPDWRPTSDYRQGVSAQSHLGGGVLLELSHDLDYLGWLFGPFDTAYCVTAHTGALDADVEDRADALLTRDDAGPVASVHLDFLQRALCRTLKVVGERGTLIWDLAANTIHWRDGAGAAQCLYEDKNYERNRMYLDQLTHFAQVARGEVQPMVGIDDALLTLRCVDALKRSAALQQAVRLEAAAP